LSISRVQFFRRGAAAAAGGVGLGLLGAPAAGAHEHGGDPSPRPIPGGFAPDFSVVPSDPFLHAAWPAVGFEMSTITDFNGVIAAAEVQGTAQGSDGSKYWFDCDMRFMEGVYVSMDGRLREASFGFV
jgi:hypothetical protein